MNSSNYHPHWKSYLPRYIRTYTKIPRNITSANLVVSSYTEVKQMKKEVMEFIRLNQTYY